jgi:hypothetical protein
MAITRATARLFFCALLLAGATALSAGTPGPISPRCDRACLMDVMDRYLAAVAAHDPSRAPLAPSARLTENGQLMEPGDGIWATTERLGSYQHYVIDPQGGAVAYVGTIQEGGEMSALALRLKIENGWISQVEQLVFRNEGRAPGKGKQLDAMKRKAIWDETLQPHERVPRERMIEIANAYFTKIERGNGNHPAPFDKSCNRTENGEQTTNVAGAKIWVFAMGCEEQIATGMFVFDTQLRDRRFPVIDEEKGVVYAHVFFDHGGTEKTWKHLQTGEVHQVPQMLLRPHAYEIHEVFKIKNGRIHEIEAVVVDVPYKMRSGWENAMRSSEGCGIALR